MSSAHLSAALVLIALVACDQSVGPASNFTRIRIRIATTGVSLDPDGYYLHLRGSGGEEVRWVQLTSLTTLDRLPGTYTASLADISPNCVLAGAPERTFTAAPDLAADSTEFDLACAHADGSITVYTNLPATNGPGPFPISLLDSLQGGHPRWLGRVDSTRFTDLADGLYAVRIDSVNIGLWSSDPENPPTNLVQVRVTGGKSDPAMFPAILPF